MNKAIFFDRDGTLNDDEKGYTHKVEDFKLLPGVIEGLKLLKEFKLFIITNQSGIGKKYYSEEDMHNYNKVMLTEFAKHEIIIEKIYFCPHTAEDNCDCRKPLSKFVKEAEKEFDLDLQESFVIGDHPSDILLAKNSGCKNGIYLLTGHGKRHFEEAKEICPACIANDFLEAINYILN